MPTPSRERKKERASLRSARPFLRYLLLTKLFSTIFTPTIDKEPEKNRLKIISLFFVVCQS